MMNARWLPWFVLACVVMLLGAGPEGKPAKAPRTLPELRAALAENAQKAPAFHSALIEYAGKDAAKVAARQNPFYRERLALLEGAMKVGGAPVATELRYDYLYTRGQLACFGDAETVKALTTASQGKGPEAHLAKLSQAFALWTSASKPETQLKALELVRGVAKETPEDDDIVRLLDLFAHNFVRSRELSAAAIEIIYRDLKGPAAAKYKAMPHVGQPFILKGVTTTGKAFTSESLKGKTVLICFWSPANAAARQFLPYLEKLVGPYKAQGLEVVGVASAENAPQLAKFLTDNKEYQAWTHLFDIKTPTPHPLATLYGVKDQNAVWLVDKGGVLQAMDARDKLEEYLPKILADKPLTPAGK